MLLYVHRNRRRIRDGSPGRPPADGIFVQFLHFEANWRPRLVSPLRGTDPACDNYGEPAWPSGKAVRR